AFSFLQTFTDGAFYSATSNNFLGTEPIILRSMQNPVRTEFKTSWLNEPSFVGMEIVPESEFSPDGDDDKIYVFFTETAVEFEFYDKILVSRIARICKCIDNFARSMGYNTSSDLPDKVLQFARDHPLMDSPVSPIDDRPALLKRSSNYTRIVVDRVTGLDKQTYDVMFLGTDDGYLHKAFNCDGEMFIVEELQLFLSPEPVQFLQLSAKKGMLYVGSMSEVVQLPVSGCHRYKYCLDCILARDPYCAWSRASHACVLLSDQTGDTKNLIQNVKYGDASSCLSVENDVRKYLFTLGNNVHLKCVPLSNLARVVWKFNGSRIQDKDSKYLLYDGGIAIFNVTVAETGFYDCLSVETSKAKEFFFTVARYALYAYQSTEKANVNAVSGDSNEAVGFQSSLSTDLLKDATKQKSVGSQKENLLLKLLSAGFALLFFFLFIWNFYKGHISLPWKIRATSSKDTNADSKNPELTTGRSGAVRESSAIQTDMSFLNE
ncbi:hypothetical protein CIB84_002178, partial [Bambusicola thoracicus]